MMTLLLKRCPHCGIQTNAEVGNCRGCGKNINVKLPGPKVITDTGRFGL